MKKTITYIYLVLLCAAFSVNAVAQTPATIAQNDRLLYNQDLPRFSGSADSVELLKLEKEANLPARASYQDVKASDMQEIIFFANTYGDTFDFRASVIQLLEVYKNHPDKKYRLLAVASLHAIGDPYGMEASGAPCNGCCS